MGRPLVSSPCLSYVLSNAIAQPNTDSQPSRIREFLDGGIASSSRLDGLGKGIGEYLRSRVVDVPEEFLARGTI